MILQPILYPDGHALKRDLYVRCHSGNVAVIGEERRVCAHSALKRISFDTYFNCFSIKKWHKYTRVEDIRLRLSVKGRARIGLTRLESHGETVDTYVAETVIVDHPELKTIELRYPPFAGEDAFSFFVDPLEKGVEIAGGAYVTDIDEASLPEINFSLAVCTYRREMYVRRNMDMLRREVFENPASRLHGHVRVYIADNGQTLKQEWFDPEHVTVIPNKNCGGSGGFSRACMEAVRDADYPRTHVVMMDDDISFTAAALERAYVFLRVLKPQYDRGLLGGAMLREDKEHMQHAAGERHQLAGIVDNKLDYNMRKIDYVLRNEEEETVNYLGWWFCCVPVDVMRERAYSLPMFFQYDDVEYGLRNRDLPMMTLNGICCWHLAFDKKWSCSKLYYAVRNRMIVSCIHYDDCTAKWFKGFLRGELFRRLLQYSYKECDVQLEGAEDFLRGPKWLVEQDPEALNRHISEISDKLVEISTLPVDFTIGMIRHNEIINTNQIKRRLRWLSLNGWLLPTKYPFAIVELDNPQLQHVYRVKKLLKYDKHTKKGLLVEKDYKRVFGILKRYYEVCRLIDKRFDAAVKEYREAYPNLITEEFWDDYFARWQR